MVYYQILKQRRKDLNLSIHDVSSQTRLAPQYIAAIEENDLEIFVGDFDFVRYFVANYAQAIGVNWDFIKDDVELNISQYMHAKAQMQQMAQSQENITITRAPISPIYEEEIEVQPTFKEVTPKVVEQPVKKKSSSKKKKSKKNKSKKSKSMNLDVQKGAKEIVRWTTSSRRSFIISVGVVAVLALVAINLVLNKISSESSAAQEREKQAELKAKEEETAKLANQKKKTSQSSNQPAQEETEKKTESKVQSDSVLTCIDQQSNIYTVTNLIESDQRLTFEISLPEESSIAVYQDDTPINDTETAYSGTYSESFTIDHTCVIQLEIKNFKDNQIVVNGQSITFDKTYWYEGGTAIIYFEIKTNDAQSAPDEEIVAQPEEEYYEEGEY